MEMPGGADKPRGYALRNGTGLSMTVGTCFTGQSQQPSRFRALVTRFPRPLRFLGVGGLGLASDIALFTILAWQGLHPLTAGFLALAAATVLTWRLNRAFTFDRSGRHQ